LATGFMRNDGVLDDILPLNIPITPNYLLNVYLKEILDKYNRNNRLGTIFSTANRNWEIAKQRTVEQINMTRIIGVHIEPATIGDRYRSPYATLLDVSDKTMHGKSKLSDEAQDLYEDCKHRHLELVIDALCICRQNWPECQPIASIRATSGRFVGCGVDD